MMCGRQVPLSWNCSYSMSRCSQCARQAKDIPPTTASNQHSNLALDLLETIGKADAIADAVLRTD
jgi:hypothetical protein